MADNKAVVSEPVSRDPMVPKVSPIVPVPGQKRLPEPFVRVEDEVLPTQMRLKGLDPLHRVRGMSERNALSAGIDVPTKKE
jgi:hypothetical protein